MNNEFENNNFENGFNGFANGAVNEEQLSFQQCAPQPVPQAQYAPQPAPPQFAPEPQYAPPQFAPQQSAPPCKPAMPYPQQQYQPQPYAPQPYGQQPFYAPLPNAIPVPVPTPHTHVQLAPIVIPIAFVPYSTQNQPLFTFEDEE
jgi:hypothetical protein